ncbi:MAG: helix-hairpin-helix domain-containing protein [Saprospiraceae bacterium]|nr:helix-hairpin-helix domain-containing protein [Saprospiraceae bacterium]
MSHLSNNIYLNKKERLGLFTLLFILFISIVIPYFIYRPSRNITSLTADYNKIDSTSEKNKNSDPTTSRTELQKTEVLHTKSNVQNIIVDPNTMTAEEARKIGISEKTQLTIQKYLQTGARFKKIEDLKKIYGISPSKYNQIKKHFKISEKTNSKPITPAMIKNNDRSIQRIEINSATQSDLEQLPGIGAKLAFRILRYKESLNGFVSINQLREIYHLEDSVFNKIKDLISCTPLITKLKVNSSDIDELNAHPYINYNEAKFIVNYRRQHEKIYSLKELAETKIFSTDWLVKIAPYLNFD